MLAHRFDQDARRLADKHYSRQTIGAPNFSPPGRLLVLKTPDLKAYWTTSWPFAEYVRHEWGGAWICSAFRNEGDTLSSTLVREAVAVTRWKWGEPPALGMITFVDSEKVRHKRDPGRCFLKAGFHRIGKTQGGLIALQLLPDEMPAAVNPIGGAASLFDTQPVAPQS